MSRIRLTTAGLGLVLAATLLTPFQRDLAVGDETKYAEVVREMRAGGGWFLPSLNGEPFTHKPPVHFWLIALLTYPFGVYSTWSFVLPSIAALVFLAAVMWRMRGPLAAFICCTALMVWVSAQTARMDVSFTACLTLAIWHLERAFDSAEETERSRQLLRCAIWLGIATLIKGPMAPLIALLLFGFECWRRRSVPRASYGLPVAAMIVIPLAWFVPAVVLGGGHFAQEVIVKQTVGRAIASWVHRAPPWYYLLHLPGVLLPWFFAAVVAARRANRFCWSWIAAVLVPYSLMSSKLDVYMMALIPPVALMIADAAETDAVRIANMITLGVVAIVALVGRSLAKPPELSLPGVQRFLIILAAASIAGIVVSALRPPLVSTLATGLAPVIAFVYAAVALMPLLNERATTLPLIAVLQKQAVPPEEIALYSSPYLWSRDFPRPLEHVRYVDSQNIGDPTVIATSRAHAEDIRDTLRRYRHVDQLQMIGKWFDVYRK